MPSERLTAEKIKGLEERAGSHATAQRFLAVGYHSYILIGVRDVTCVCFCRFVLLFSKF